jgi:hypothetical protein
MAQEWNSSMENAENKINEAADEALANSMYRHTFGIIGDGKRGIEGRGLGTGVGVIWNGSFLILTASHTMQITPDERLFFLLPYETVVFQGSGIHVQPALYNISNRVQLESKTILLDDERDLAAFVLANQTEEQLTRHFYLLDDSHTTPQSAKQIGFVGYPAKTKLSVGLNFMASPYSSFGEMVDLQEDWNPDSEVAVSYLTSNSVDPPGLSGSGLWLPKSSAGGLWTPGVSLIGLITQYEPKHQLLLGIRVEELTSFLKTNLS